MSWNYRVVRFDKGNEIESYFQIHEVFYSKDGKIVYWTENAVKVHWYETEGLDGGKNELQKLMYALKRPVLNSEDLPK